MDYKVKGVRPRGRPKKTWKEVMEKDCWRWQLDKDAVAHSKWRKLLKGIEWYL